MYLNTVNEIKKIFQDAIAENSYLMQLAADKEVFEKMLDAYKNALLDEIVFIYTYRDSFFMGNKTAFIFAEKHVLDVARALKEVNQENNTFAALKKFSKLVNSNDQRAYIEASSNLIRNSILLTLICAAIFLAITTLIGIWVGIPVQWGLTAVPAVALFLLLITNFIQTSRSFSAIDSKVYKLGEEISKVIDEIEKKYGGKDHHHRAFFHHCLIYEIPRIVR